MAFSRRHLPVETSALCAGLPDWSRAVEVGTQKLWRSLSAEIYNDMGEQLNGNSASEGVMDGVFPYVLEIKYPCYIVMCGKGGGDVSTDMDHTILYSKKKSVVAAMHTAGSFNNFVTQMAKSTYGVSPGNGWYNFGTGHNSDFNTIPIPLTNIGWYCRPAAGTIYSQNENVANMSFFVVPMFGTPSGTVLAHRTLFVATARANSINSAITWGTNDTSANTSFITVANNSGYTKNVHQPLKVVAP